MKKNNDLFDKNQILIDNWLSLDYNSFIELVVKKKLNLEIENKIGDNLLLSSLKRDKIEIFYTLVYLKVDLNKVNNLGENILQYSLKYSNDLHISQEIAKKYVSVLKENNKKQNSFYYLKKSHDIIYFTNWAKLNNVDILSFKDCNNLNILEYHKKNTAILNLWNKYL